MNEHRTLGDLAISLDDLAPYVRSAILEWIVNYGTVTGALRDSVLMSLAGGNLFVCRTKEDAAKFHDMFLNTQEKDRWVVDKWDRYGDLNILTAYVVNNNSGGPTCFFVEGAANYLLALPTFEADFDACHY